MSDPTTRRATAARSQPPALRPKTVALAGVAVDTLILAALAFTLSFDRCVHSPSTSVCARNAPGWHPSPSTSHSLRNRRTRCHRRRRQVQGRPLVLHGLATLTVLLSVAGNSSTPTVWPNRPRTRLERGRTRLHPATAYRPRASPRSSRCCGSHCCTCSPSLLRVIVDERTAPPRVQHQEPAMMQRASAPERTTTPSTGRNDAAGAGTDPVDVAHDDASAEHHDTEPATVDASASHTTPPRMYPWPSIHPPHRTSMSSRDTS